MGHYLSEMQSPLSKSERKKIKKEEKKEKRVIKLFRKRLGMTKKELRVVFNTFSTNL